MIAKITLTSTLPHHFTFEAVYHLIFQEDITAESNIVGAIRNV